MMKRRVFSLLLSALLLAAPLTACAGGSGADTTVPAGTTAAPAETTAPPETEPVEVRDTADLPKDLDMSGYTFRILQQEKNSFVLIENAPEEMNGEIINDTVFKRNASLEQKYGFKVQKVTASSIKKTFMNAVLANSSDFDMAYNSISGIVEPLLNGQAVDLLTVPHIDLTKNYWDQGALEDLSIGGKMYYGIGDIHLSDDESMQVALYNSDLGKEIGIENLYKAVEEGRWTYELMMKYIKQATNDVDGNGVLDGSDVIGYLYISGTSFSYHSAAMNLSLFPLAKDGSISFDPNIEKTQRVFEILMQLQDPSTSFDWSTVGSSADQGVFITNMMSSKQALFQTMILSQVRRLYPDVTAGFGVLPMPKMDENQDTYHTTLNRGNTMVVTIPACNPDLERTGFAIEAMAEASGELFDAYYEVCMGAKYTRDPESYGMIKLSRENVVYDPGFCYAWGKLYSTLDKLVKERNDAVASTLAEMTSVAEAGMKEYFEAIQKNG